MNWFVSEALPFECPKDPWFVDPSHYGYYCGFFRPASCHVGVPTLNPEPWDAVDRACAYHDCCVGTRELYVDKCNHAWCNFEFCSSLMQADCTQSMTPSHCEYFRAKAIALACGTLDFRPGPPLPLP